MNIQQIFSKNFIIIAVIVVVVGGFLYLDKDKIFQKNITPQAAAEKAINYINTNLLPQGTVASLVNVVEQNGVYKIHIKVGDSEFDSFVSRDGQYLFPDGIELATTTASQNNQNQTGGNNTQAQKNDKPDVKLFVMSFCPYGNQAEDIMKPVVDLLGSKINLSVHYIVSKGSDGKYLSLHGDQELNQDVREICVSKYQQNKYWAFIEAINKSCTSQNADSCWENVAKSIGIDTAKIKDCAKSEVSSLLDKEIELTNSLSISGSPQLFVNGTEYQGNRTSEAYKTAICSAFNSAPAECQTTLSDASTSASGGCQ